jgi:hypothetical protein
MHCVTANPSNPAGALGIYSTNLSLESSTLLNMASKLGGLIPARYVQNDCMQLLICIEQPA